MSNLLRPSRWTWWLKSLFRFVLAITAGAMIIAGVGFAQRLGWIRSGHEHATAPASAGPETSDVVYVCPMMCTPARFPEPGRCPVCGMELVPVSAGGSGASHDHGVHIEPAARRLANIQTATVEARPVDRVIRTVGEISFDESRRATISSYVDGRIEQLFADYTGVDVAVGDHMVLLYSPDLYAAQVEYLVSRESVGESSPRSFVARTQHGLRDNAHEKLRELGMTEEQIEELEERNSAETRLQICAPIGGTVIEKLRQEGDYVKVGDPVYRIADLSVVWLMLELFPEDAAQIHYGQKVEAIVQSLPDEVFTGRVAFIDRVVNRETRTVGVRVEMLNPEGRLRPGDYATASVRIPVRTGQAVYDPEFAGKWISPRHPQIVQDGPGRCPLCDIDLVPASEFGFADTPVETADPLVVPRDAVLMAGQHSVVYVETEPGRFELRPIVLGPLTDEGAVILGGLKQGEIVATTGNFLIDSQMQLAGNPSLIDPTRAVAPTGSETNDPIDVEAMPLVVLDGAAGTAVDQLFEAYFAIQQSLAGDEGPRPEDIERLRTAVSPILAAPGIDPQLRELLSTIGEHAGELTGDLETDRGAFKPISHAVVRLAAGVRGPDSQEPFYHFFCPMVEGGGGDWLQPVDKLANPYFGSRMLHCGRQVDELVGGPNTPNLMR